MLTTVQITGLLAIVLAGAQAAVDQSPSVDWGAAANDFVEDSSTDLLSAGSLVLVGTFDITMTTIQENQDPAFLFNHFATFGGTGATNAQGIEQEGA